ncbi:hypothetical protein Pmar_PMAR015944 [Perkinsus marinus ATCC 50983]|uniref:Uncharacterized protein n=1 Tax=Perkinsus marinus (strain ATCC 50983 / TXsc) TaxID=423536 RepID=C5LAQ4_PERM5|nr:hypothetical protein Pmar_PMAR015944 [Perkinsus marinus ATCC 50983]EER06182.1 hypothetical protein Pmar_PMAR015944 [Perkinsus marinus ATCC 50983]|eukprot:XP_002774366.1 hypothetical protein Pmar_PMAR015944 [Perkinsus marinus ATCC 50983]
MDHSSAVLDAYVTLTSEDVHRITALAKSLVATEFPTGGSSEKVEIPVHPQNFLRYLREMESLGTAARGSLEQAETCYEQLTREIKELSRSKPWRKDEYITETRAKKLTYLLNKVADARKGFETCVEKQKAKAEKASRAREDVAQSLQKTDQLIDLIDAKLNSAIRQPAELTPGNSQGGFGDGPTAVVMAGRRQTKRRRSSSSAYNTISKRSRGR